MRIDQYRVFGNPVAHSRSPWIHARFAALTGQTLQYERQLAPSDGFAAALKAFREAGGRGCNVTVPFKYDAFALATQHSPRAVLAQAANTLSLDGPEVFADNTDGVGLVNDIGLHAKVPLRSKAILLVGAGGAAAGVLGPLLEARPHRLLVVNRTVDKAQVLVARHMALAQAQHVALAAGTLHGIDGCFDAVINATASSLQGAAVPIDAAVLAPGALAYDMMYGPPAQAFMAWAAAHGAVPRDGLGMLVEQAAEAFALWRGVRPPSSQVLAELRASLA